MACEDGHVRCAEPKPGRFLSESPVRAPPSSRPRRWPARLNTLNLTEKYAQAWTVNPVLQRETRPLMIKVVEAFDHEQGLRSRVILPDRCPAAPLRGHRLRIPGTGTVTARLPGGRVGPATRSAPDPGPPLLPGLPVALCLVAVLRGATSLAAIARFAADTDSELREQLGLTSSTPNASTLGRLLARLDGYALDDAVGA